MSRDGEGRAELRELEAAAPGGLAAADAERAFMVLRRGGLRFYRLSEGYGLDFCVLGTVVGPDGWTETRFREARRQYEELLESWRVRAALLRARMVALEEAANGPLDQYSGRAGRDAGVRARVDARERRISARVEKLLRRRADAVGGTFLDHLERFHGFAEVPIDLGFNVWSTA